MSFTITNPLSTTPLTPAGPASNPPAAQQTQATAQPADKVTLSESQQVIQLSRQGHTAAQIAASLALTVATVNSYLGVVSTQQLLELSKVAPTKA